ncbi:MAG TPA: alpha/beta fold hydrolase [Gemmatimonadaceae bacterium]|nr:alpha/beta fold hydrolase [Gemmatimonadaceae bacterium]
MSDFDQQVLFKRLDDLDFQIQLGRQMIVRNVLYAGAEGMIIPAYLFLPLDTTAKHPVVITIHGGVHGDFEHFYIPEVRSLVGHGYVVIAPEYRGSTGYGRAHYDAIDYGGKEVDDVIAARAYLATYVPSADISRLGIMGWSHGGYITLLSIFRHPELFRVAVAHVPVTDLVTRMHMHSPEYRQIFAAQQAFGGTVEQNPTPYIDRSPIAHARELRTPLLVLTADNDDDVFIQENHNLRDSMVAAGKMADGLYTYREWHDPPGKHEFSRVDTPQAHEAWDLTLGFLGKYLQ